MLSLPQRPRRLLLLLVAALLLGMIGLGAVNLWAWHHFRAAQQALHDDNLDDAHYHVSQCLRIWHGAQTHFLAARIERMRDDFPEAEKHLQECIRLQHGPTEATEVEQLLLRAQRGSLSQVEAVLWQCVEAGHAEKVWILEALARIYLREAHLSMALRCLDRWLECEPNVARAWHWRGWVHERLQEPEKAIADYERAVEIDPARWGARLRLVRVLLDQHEAKKARPHVDELERTHPDDPGVQVALALCLNMQGEAKKAIGVLDPLLASHPSEAEALTLRGQLAYEEESPAAAETWLQKALKQRPQDVATLYTLSKCLQEQGKKDAAAEMLVRHKAAQTDTMRLTELLNREIERSPRDADLLSEVGAILLRRGEDQEGLQWLYRALAANPNHKPTHQLLVNYFAAHNEEQQAAKHRRYLSGATTR